MIDWERRKAQGGDIYGYYDSQSGSSNYDDPRDYRKWCDWSDVEDDEKVVATHVGEEIVASGCALRIVADDAGVAAVVSCAFGDL